jgi:hypothetical protein
MLLVSGEKRMSISRASEVGEELAGPGAPGRVAAVLDVRRLVALGCSAEEEPAARALADGSQVELTARSRSPSWARAAASPGSRAAAATAARCSAAEPRPPAAPRRASSRRTFNSLPTRHWRHSHALPERAPRGCSAACVESASVARGRADGRVGRGRGAARYPWLRTLPPRASRKRCGSVPEELEDRRKGRDESERDQRRGRTCDGAPRDLTVAQHCVE